MTLPTTDATTLVWLRGRKREREGLSRNEANRYLRDEEDVLCSLAAQAGSQDALVWLRGSKAEEQG